jgi:hypothetical protein
MYYYSDDLAFHNQSSISFHVFFVLPLGLIQAMRFLERPNPAYAKPRQRDKELDVKLDGYAVTTSLLNLSVESSKKKKNPSNLTAIPTATSNAETYQRPCPSQLSSQPSGPASTHHPDAVAPSTSTQSQSSPSTTGSRAIETRSSLEGLSKLPPLGIGLSIGLRRKLLRRGGRGVGSVELWLRRRRCLLLVSGKRRRRKGRRLLLLRGL